MNIQEYNAKFNEKVVGSLSVVEDDIDTLQEDVEILESDTTTLSSDVETLKNTVGYTASKNLLENTGTTTTDDGITYTVNDDGSVTINGTSTGESQLFINRNFYLSKGEYILSGRTGTPNSNCVIQLYDGVKSVTDQGLGNTYSCEGRTINYVRILINNAGVAFDNVTFYPMIRRANITDDTYEPYVNGSVDARLEELKSALNNVIKWKLVKSITTSSSNIETITLPNEFNELYVEVIPNEGNVLNCPSTTIVIPKNILNSTVKYFSLPAYFNSSNSYGYCRIEASLTSLKLRDYYINGSSCHYAGAIVKVYYR